MKCSSFFEFTPFYIVITKALVIESYILNVTIVFGYIFCFYDKFPIPIIISYAYISGSIVCKFIAFIAFNNSVRIV